MEIQGFRRAIIWSIQEQTTIAKLGLELCLHTSDLDSEVERWDEQDHEIVRLCQIISSMAYSMYLFTRYPDHFINIIVHRSHYHIGYQVHYITQEIK